MSTHGGTGFYINDQLSYVKWNDLNSSLHNNLASNLIEVNLASNLIEVNLPKKIILSVGIFINKHPIMLIAYFNSKYLT